MGLPIRHASIADRDVVSIVDRIAEENLLAALEVGEAIRRTSSALVEHPHLGERFIDHRLPELRRVLVMGFSASSIYYQVLPDEILILRVLHNSRDIETILATPDR